MFHKALLATTIVAATTMTGCEPPHVSLHGGPVVTGDSLSRSGGREIHYAECAEPGGKPYRVRVSAAAAKQLRDGQRCPAGVREPLPQDKHPQLYQELTKRLPYGGGDRSSACGAWETVSREEARLLVKKCPPLRWGKL